MIAYILFKIIDIIKVLVIIRIVLSWIAPSRNEFTELVYNVTEPFLAPFRFRVPLGHMYLDIAPIVLYFVLGLAKRLIFYIF